VYLVQVS